MKKKIMYSSVIVLSILLLLPALEGQIKKTADQDDRLSYAVSVNAQLVPIFAVDKKGNPVFDLKQEEIQLYANGKPVEIIYFYGYSVTEQEQVPGQPLQKTTGQLKSRGRMNFIIMDSLVSNIDIFSLSRAIAMGIIKNAPPIDWFIIMESNQISGFQYVFGPEKDKKKLAQAIRSIKHRYLRREFVVDPALYRELSMSQGGRMGNPGGEIMAMVIQMHQDIIADNRWAYQQDLRVLGQSLERLKYALKTITLPKTVFLITANPQKRQLGTVKTKDLSMPVTYYDFLEDAAKAINRGGSMFYLINPLMYRSKHLRNEMKYITEAGAGKLIHGASIPEIVEKVKNSTSAYYEMAFYPDKEPGAVTRISVKCKRKGVELITIGYTEQAKSYTRMNDTEKKLFALDIVNRGDWSRRVATVGRIKYQKLPDETSQTTVQTIQLNIPPTMRNRLLEMVLVYVNPVTLEATFERKQTIMVEKEKIRIPLKQDRDVYFLIIEPQTPLCIYNQVI